MCACVRACARCRSDGVCSHVCRTRSCVFNPKHDPACARARTRVCVLERTLMREGANKNGYFACRSGVLVPPSSVSWKLRVALLGFSCGWSSDQNPSQCSHSSENDQLFPLHPCEACSKGTRTPEGCQLGMCCLLSSMGRQWGGGSLKREFTDS